MADGGISLLGFPRSQLKGSLIDQFIGIKIGQLRNVLEDIHEIAH